MKRATIVVAAALFAAACNNSSKQETRNDTAAAPQAEAPAATAATQPAGKAFDINSLPVSGNDLGEFPFFSFPKGIKPLNKPLQRQFDRLYFPLTDGMMTPVEGRIFKTHLTGEAADYSDWSLPYLEKSYAEAITAVGGVKVFDGKVSGDEMKRIDSEAKYFGEEGSLDYWNDNVKTYVIRRADGRDVYIQFSGNTAGGSLQILQKEGFKQTITMLKADEIKKQITEKGKAVLHINFDTDKATLKPDGKDAVAEIAKVLQSESGLQLAINGYTDNSGNDAHNLQLSKDRAAAVLGAITAAGIDKARLSSEGFGAKDPIAPNDTEEGKAQNRRVELVKK